MPMAAPTLQTRWQAHAHHASALWRHPNHRRRIEVASLRLERQQLRQQAKDAFNRFRTGLGTQ